MSCMAFGKCPNAIPVYLLLLRSRVNKGVLEQSEIIEADSKEGS